MLRLLLPVTLLGCASSSTAPERPPNFVIVLADDMGYGDASVYDGWIEMPGLERMAAEGLLFTDFHTSGVVCSPTRAGLVTGRYQERCGIPGVINADPAHPAHAWGLADEEVTFAEVLREAGYATAIFGKWHLGYEPRFNPTLHGFDEFRGFISGNIDYHSHVDRMGTADWWHGTERVEREGYLTDLITEDAVDFIHRKADRPFCLYVAHGAPHSPIQARDSGAVRGPGKVARPNGDRARDETVQGMMQALDEGVAAILEALVQNDLGRDTLVLFMSDNGGARHMRNTPLRGGKGQVWEGGHRVPALAWWPGTIEAGTRTDALCWSLDVFPTMLDLAGTSSPRLLDGRSLVPVFADRANDTSRQLYWLGRAMRDGDWKLVENEEGAALFDLSSDPGEESDVSEENPDRVAAMLGALAQWRAETEASAPR